MKVTNEDESLTASIKMMQQQHLLCLQYTASLEDGDQFCYSCLALCLQYFNTTGWTLEMTFSLKNCHLVGQHEGQPEN